MKIDKSALLTVREYFDRRMYALVDLRMSLECEPSLTGFPPFDSLQRVVGRLDPAPETMFRLFRLGETVDDGAFRAAFPEPVVDALVCTELVIRTGDGWRTPGLLLVPAQGLLLIAGTPPSYPTADGFPRAWFDLSTNFVAATLPGSLRGARVLDVCSGTGVQSLLCAIRGAESVLGVELDESGVVIASANAVLNGVADRVEFRVSDVLSALHPEETFDFVVANLPYAPVIGGTVAPDSVTGIGNAVLWPLLEQLPAHLSEAATGILATWRSIGHGGDSYQLRAITESLAAVGAAVTAYLDPAFDTVDGVLRMLHKDLSRRDTPVDVDAVVASVRRLVERAELPMDGFYNQLIHFSRAGGTAPAAVFGLARPGTA
ncbi:50S ribosomal protein L11 methyltransferase [Amycolatopsis cihanbeyliensis]|uniref:Ribosomal protein L11 methyltransferase PrmA n=1 Tax=Amycolatopsis cihanbeyliensis TaxID=1128664 RepID=A0A542DBI0_AMYCI|nr:50S ribosomal protein L11 methyltransferase [Amycolatopsis cihanbeyliensis]TQJ00438.1 ribosomal protein L11 methyltransferase PrmA [Amycolatopsis cihanbeyliensis]